MNIADTSLLLVDSDDDNNPWSMTAAALDTSRGAVAAGQQQLADESSFRGDHHIEVTDHPDLRNDVEENACYQRLSKCTFRLLFVSDLFGGILLLVTGIHFLNNNNYSDDDGGGSAASSQALIPILIVTWGSLLLIRSFLVILAKCVRFKDEDNDDVYDECCRLLALKCNVRIVTPVLAVYYAVLAILAGIYHPQVCDFISSALLGSMNSILESVSEWICGDGDDDEDDDDSHYYVVWTSFLALFIIESIRHNVGKKALLREVQRRARDEDNEGHQRHSNRRNRPWWWQSGRRSMTVAGDGITPQTEPNDFATDELRESLLTEQEKQQRASANANANNSGLPEWVSAGRRMYHERTGVTPGRRRRRGRRIRNNTGDSGGSWFSGWRSSTRDDDHIRGDDNDSDSAVDFASVQSEWASRTEEDPLWWSRDTGDNGGNSGNNGGNARRANNNDSRDNADDAHDEAASWTTR